MNSAFVLALFLTTTEAFVSPFRPAVRLTTRAVQLNAQAAHGGVLVRDNLMSPLICG